MKQDRPGANPQGQTPLEKDQYYYHPDHLGSSSYISDAQGQVYEHLEYFPFGETWVEEASNTQRTPYLFTSKELDEETGLYYFGARYYDPRTSVWQSADPILDEYLDGAEAANGLPGMGGIYNPQNLGLYSYGHLNPVRYIDPDGNAAETPWDVFHVGLGVASFVDNVRNRQYLSAAVDAAGVIGDSAAALTPFVPGGLGATIKVIRAAGKGSDGLKTTTAAEVAKAGAKGAPEITKAYKRPSGATTVQQRASVQGKACVDCGAVAPKQVADHKNPLVKEYYETGTIDKTRMRSVNAVQPQCPTCSARQGANMSRYSQQMKKERGLD